MLVLPFSSPCLLQPPSFSLPLAAQIDGLRGSVNPAAGNKQGTSRELGAAKGSPPCPALRPAPEAGDRTGAEALQPLTAQVRNRALERPRDESGEVGCSILSLHPREGWKDPSQEIPQHRDFLLGQRK